MTRTIAAAETVSMAISDLNNDTPLVDTMDEYLWFLAESTQVVDWDGYFTGTIADEWRWERDTAKWLSEHSNDPADPNYSEIYSDVFKDLYGVRPRW